jgi:hypothetical protein
VPIYVVELTIWARAPLSQVDLVEVAAIGGAAGGNVGERRLTTTLTIDATSCHEAVERGARHILDLVAGEVLSARASTEDECERQVTDNAVSSALGGTAELADLLGISKQLTSVLAATHPEFPAPLTRLKSGPVWRMADLARFADGWRRKAGRPSRARTRLHSN